MFKVHIVVIQGHTLYEIYKILIIEIFNGN